jgi:hypothetical protein
MCRMVHGAYWVGVTFRDWVRIAITPHAMVLLAPNHSTLLTLAVGVPVAGARRLPP